MSGAESNIAGDARNRVPTLVVVDDEAAGNWLRANCAR